ncbi:MAG: metallophosphoesterase [Candidatus Omnitrophica bacterium]|nr:metallophosphoesterase [Candidatus Omnitrophota bacterium]
MMKTFAIGDIHGSYKALLQCLERSKFDYQKDRLIVLGDVCDGYPEVKDCIDELLKIKHCDLVIGNHDMWALDWALWGAMPVIWTSQGGDRTMASYSGGPMLKAHIDFLKSGQLWLESNSQLFVHAGINPDLPLVRQDPEVLVWDRDLLQKAWESVKEKDTIKFGGYEDIFIGHTTTQLYKTLLPMHVSNVWALDTGAGWSGKLTIMDVNSKKYWQSDLSMELYGGTPDII